MLFVTEEKARKAPPTVSTKASTYTSLLVSFTAEERVHTLSGVYWQMSIWS